MISINLDQTGRRVTERWRNPRVGMKMRRLTPRFKRWLLHRQKSEKNKYQRRFRNRRLVIVRTPDTSWEALASPGTPMPEIMCFDENIHATSVALDRIRANLHRRVSGQMEIPSSKRSGAKIQNLGRHLRFETIEFITPAAALVLAAEFERALLAKSWKPYVANSKDWSAQVVETLDEIGFFDLLGLANAKSSAVPESRRFVLKMQSGNTTDPEDIDRLITNLKNMWPEGREASEEKMVGLYGAMVEAVGNVVNHAYPASGSFRYPHIGRWWITGAVDTEARTTTVIVFDQGVTIPVSLPSWSKYSGVVKRLALAAGEIVNASLGRSLGLPLASDPGQDAAAIHAAVEESVSSTEEGHRGHGLAQMRDFVEQCRDGRLRIMSRNGEVIYRPGKDPERRYFDVSIGGTLVEWNLQL